jgi:aspartyl-tRNA(Asn)/glutamyl-tRNA(Gln) amidotransferase subunit C
MRLSREDVKHIALLSRLHLSNEEIDLFSNQLSKILDFVEKLNELNTEGIDPKFQIIPPENVLREDVVGLSLSKEKTMLNAPETDGNYFIVPKVVKK